MADSDSNVVAFHANKASAVAEVRRQLDQSYALVYGARMILAQLDANSRAAIEPADRLLDMAEDELADLEYINCLDPPGSAT